MQSFKLVKIFDLAVAPAELQDAAELQTLRRLSADDEPMLKLWVGRRMTTIEPPSNGSEGGTVSAWEHNLHGWLSQGGAVPGDTVYLMWSNADAARSTPQPTASRS